ncbi:MAG: sulfite exporter TauE/SafE family protein [Symploca sp. SIO1B1]|nr:sulfite exporter TauE/SafE family protein [Symploca sp. SIO1C2]NER92898.1 sulfite exporter TauE/SafE family protein [Symploca sp. SIO1B1]
MLDLLLVVTLGFLGSFGHCVGMCGPLTVAFSLSMQRETSHQWLAQLSFHGLLNLGRILSYALVGAMLGGLGSVFIASGQLAGVGSALRQGMAILTGLMLVWFGCAQVKPNWLPRLPILHPLQGNLHQQLSQGMNQLSQQTRWWAPLLLGGVWGLIPCGFLFAAQIKAAGTGDFLVGAATMLAFGLGTMPIMLGVGISASRLSTDKRSQLFRLGGWVTITIGILTLLRTDAMVDYTGYGAIVLLILALIARPLSNFWAQPLLYRRALGVGAFVLAIAHTGHMLQHWLEWDLSRVAFSLRPHQFGFVAGVLALGLMTPAALTSFDNLQKSLGKRWRQIHLLSVPALLLGTIHIVLIGSHQLQAVIVSIITLMVLLVRWRLFWSILSLEKFYAGSQNR